MMSTGIKGESVWEGGNYSLFKQVAYCCLTHKTSHTAKPDDKRLGTCSEQNKDMRLGRFKH